MSSRAFVVALAGLWTIPGLPTCMNVYRTDVERICDAEHRSGKTVKIDAAGVMTWVQQNIASAQAVVLEGQLQAESPRDRAVQLRSEARSQGLPNCALADSYDAFAVDDDYKTAVSSLCSGEAATAGGNIARLDVAPADNAERMREIRDWTVTNLKGPEALAFVDRLAQTPAEGRPMMLRNEATRLGLSTCELAATLERAPPSPIPMTLVALPSYTVTRVDASQKLQEVVTGTLAGGSAAQTIDTCYGQALLKTPVLAGNVSLRLTIDAKGKVAKVDDASSSLASPAVVKCITGGLVGIQLIPAQTDPKAPAVKCGATLTLAPVRGGATPGWPSVMPTGLSPSLAPPPDPGAPDAGAPDGGKKRRGR